MVGFQGESPADRRALEGAASRSFRDVQAMSESQEPEEQRASAARVILNRPTLDIAHRRLVQSERRYGAEPRLHGCFFCKASLCDDK